MRVGISLLTLAPGDLGGSETYARQLVKALSSVGQLEYAVFVPERAKDAAGGLQRIEVRDPPAVARRGPSRIPAMALAAFRSRKVKTGLENGRRRPLRADRPRSAHEGADRGHAPRRPAPRPPRLLRAGAALVPARRLRPRDEERNGRGRDERVRARTGARRARAGAGARARDPARDQPHALPRRRRRPRAVPDLPRAAVAAQEPRQALRGVRAPAEGPPESPARPHRRRSRPARPACRRASSAGGSWRPPTSRRSTGARRASSSRACTRASACRRSRRWRAAAPSRRRTSLRSRRSAGTQPSSSTRTTRGRSQTAILEADGRADELRAKGLERAARSRGRRPPARTTTSTATPPVRSLVR